MLYVERNKKMKKEKKITIIVPVYNAEKTIERCIKSILENYNCDIEVLLIEDNSSDQSYLLCKEIANENTGVFLIRNEGKGVSAARNTGLKYATGDYVGFCDSDDWYEPKALDIVLSKFNEYNCDMIISGFNTIYDGNRERNSYEKKKSISKEKLCALIINDDRIKGSVWNKFFKRNVIEDEQFNTDLSYCEDMHFCIKIMANKSIDCRIIEDLTYNYFINPHGVTNNPELQYDSKGRLKYVVALEHMISELGLGCKLVKEAGYKIATFCLDEITRGDYSQERNKYLYGIYKKYRKEYFSRMLKYNWKWNIKRVILLQKKKYTNKF